MCDYDQIFKQSNDILKKYNIEDEELSKNKEFKDDFIKLMQNLYDMFTDPDLINEMESSKNECNNSKNDYTKYIDCKDSLKIILDNKDNLESQKAKDAIVIIKSWFEYTDNNMQSMNKSLTEMNNTLSDFSQEIETYVLIKSIDDIVKNFDISKKQFLKDKYQELINILLKYEKYEIDYVFDEVSNDNFSHQLELMANSDNKTEVKKSKRLMTIFSIIRLMTKVKNILKSL